MIVYKYSLGDWFNSIIFNNITELLLILKEELELEENMVGDGFLIEIDEMSEEEFENLPEHCGW